MGKINAAMRTIFNALMHRNLKFIESRRLTEGNISDAGREYPGRIFPGFPNTVPIPANGDGGISIPSSLYPDLLS